MQRPILRLIISGLLLATAACAPRPASTPTPTFSPPTSTLAPPTATRPPPTATIPPPTATPIVIRVEAMAEIEAWLTQLGQTGDFSGAVLVAHQGEVLLSQGYGVADRERQIPNTPQTRFRIGSITKQFTAMAILILQMRGQLRVQDLVCAYIANCPAAWEAITLQHLLTHTSGLPEFMALSDYRSTRATPSPPEQTIARFKDLPLDFPPGEDWAYSNSGYVVLGYVIEQVSGQSYEAFLQDAILTPLELTNTGYDHNQDGLAVGYWDKYSNVPADFIDMSIPHAAGALYSTIEDLYRWEEALFTEPLLLQVQMAEMFDSAVVIPNSDDLAYGYGWFVGTSNHRPFVFHTGGIEGFTALLGRYPDEQVVVIVLTNQQNKDVGLMLDIISKKIFGKE